MDQYIVSARKYRPDSFESLIGQDNIVQTLKNSIIRGQLAHAYLFCGPRGVGKTSAARIFAKTINCSNPTAEMEPCSECESCISFQEGRSYCIHELDAASNNGVDDIKALIDQVNIPPQIGKYSVYIVDEVHMLSQAAFNAFLKTLEEPPAHAIFILATTEKHKILPTILSRCQTYDFNRISIPDIVRNLKDIADKEGIIIEDESLHIIAQKADGAMRDALTIFDQTVAFCGNNVDYNEVLKNLNVLDYEHCFHLVEDFLSGNYPAALLKFDEILAKGFNALHFVAALSSHFRNLIVSKSGGLDSLLELPSSLKNKYASQAEKCNLKFLYDALNITTLCESGYRASVNPRLHIELTLMRLSFLNGNPEEIISKTTDSKAKEPKEPEAKQEKITKKEIVEKPEEAKKEEPVDNLERKTPQGRKKPAKAAATLSISSIIENGNNNTSNTVIIDNENDSLPDDETIIESWKKIPSEYKDRPRLATTISSSKIEIEEKEGKKFVTFFVVNPAQKQWIEEKLQNELQLRLQKLAGSSKLRLLIDIQAEDEIENKPFLPKDKAIELINSNPEVKHLVADLDLDTKL